jgi:CheY-like chemotaxis protein
MVRTILVVDDDRASLEAYGRLLKRLGHRVVLSDEPERLLSDPAPLAGIDLLILDQMMPRMAGLDLLACVRRAETAVPRASGPAVLLISALISDELRRRAGRLGVTEVIEKPVDAARLLSSIRAALQDEPAAANPARDELRDRGVS